MKKYALVRASLAYAMMLVLLLPGICLADGKEGKKHFKEGIKQENAEAWDQAAQQYALAVAEEPGNTEYRLRMLRASRMAALMYASRGDALAASRDYEGAYNAYARAFSYDPTQETMRLKMERMLEQRKAQSGMGEAAHYNPRTGVLLPASNEIRPVTSTRPRQEALQKIEFNEGASLKLAITTLARQLNLNVMFDESFKDVQRFSLSLSDVTVAKALDLILMQNKLIFEHADRRTIVVYADNPTNRQRMERLLVKTFYLANADLNETRTIVQTNIGPQRQVTTSKQLNALVVRATAAELAVAQSLIENLDKNRSEVVLDVNIYEVSDTTSTEIGNQLATSGIATTKTTYDTDGNPVTVTTGTSTSLASLGGLGLASVSAISGNVFGLGSGLGTIIGLPPSSLSLLQSKGKSRLLASTQIHALDGEQNQTVVGRSVPVRTGTSYLGAYTGAATATTGSLTGSTVDNIQYRDVGLVIDVQPVITNEGYVQIKMKLESSNVEASGTDSQLTPAFTKRSLTTISRVQDSVTAVVASVKQDSSGDSRATIPVIGMLPILGRLFSAPKQSNSRSDIVITVTPHIIRPSEIKPEDHLARFSGTQQSGFTMSIEEVVHRAEQEEEQERRLIAGDRMPAPLPAAPKGADATVVADKRNADNPRPRVVSAAYLEKAPVEKSEPGSSTGQPNRDNRP